LAVLSESLDGHIVPTLARFVSVETAARLFLLASQTLVVSGAIALEIAVRGDINSRASPH
jgi:hypothetical protein